MSMYSSRASVLRWQERNAGLTISSTSQSIALEAFPQKLEVPNTHDAVKRDKYHGLFSAQTIPCLLAIILQLLVILIIVVFNLVEVTLTMPGIFSNDARALYILGITIGATAITTYISKQIKMQWLNYIEMRRIRKADTTQSSRRIEHLLGVGPSLDYIYYWGTSISFVLASLSIASIVAALVPSTGYRTFPTTAQLTPGALNCTTFSNEPISDAVSWKLENGTFINYPTRGNTCLGHPAVALASKITTSTVDKDGYAYTISGVGITRSSIGVPYDAHNGPSSFDKIFWDIGDEPINRDRGNFQESTQCLPVFVSNPARCRRAGLVVSRTTNITVQLEDEDCIISTPIYGVDLTKDGASASGFCASKKKIGAITFLIGSVNSHAGLLASALNDFPAINAKAYSVACEVDIASAIAFRQTRISRNSKPPYESTIKTPNMSISPVAEFSISSYEASSCNSKSYVPSWNPNNERANILTAAALAVGAAAAFPLFSQNRYNDGWWETLSQAIQDRKSSSFGFKDSENALEDVLGLISAINFGQYVGSAQEPQSIRQTPKLLNYEGSSRLIGYRVGSGSPWGLLFIIPQVWTILLLLFLLIRRIRL